MTSQIGLAIVLAFVGLMLLSRIGRTRGADAQRLVEGGALLLDVRSAGEFSGGHLAGALNVPVGELSARIAELGAKDRPVVVYCASGTRSRFARSILRRAGFAQVHDLGPMSAWPSR